MKYWAYKHINGSIHVRGYRDDLPNARVSIDDAYDSSFVDHVLEPYEAEDRPAAEAHAKTILNKKEIA